MWKQNDPWVQFFTDCTFKDHKEADEHPASDKIYNKFPFLHDEQFSKIAFEALVKGCYNLISSTSGTVTLNVPFVFQFGFEICGR